MRSLDQRASGASSTRASVALRASGAALSIALGFALSGCSISYPLTGGDKDDLRTGSIQPSVTPAPHDQVTSQPLAPPPGAAAAAPEPAATTPAAYAPTAPQPGEEPTLNPADWAYARGALSIAMSADATYASVPWANPDSGAYGSFSATAGQTTENGATCRAFSATHSAGGAEKRLEGNACRTAAGHWEAVSIHTAQSHAL
ncbi:MAG: RT0821/Lpp0805 family surface protein [Hansschlegelia sp.]